MYDAYPQGSARLYSPQLDWPADVLIEQEFDCSVSFLHNSRPFLTTSEVNMTLPSPSTDWEAETAHAWGALHPWTASFPVHPQLKPLIRTLVDEPNGPIGTIPDDRQHLMIILTLVRMVWTLKEIRGFPINDLIKDDLGHRQVRLMRALEAVHAPLPLPLPDTSTQHRLSEEMIRQTSLIHIAHLYDAGDLMNFLYPLLRRDRSPENQNHQQDEAKVRMLEWSRADPARVRSVIYHCSQLLGLARRYPTNMPFQPFAIFHGGVILYYVAGLLASSTSPNPAVDNLRELKLDRLDSQPRSDAMDWIETGGPAILSLQEVPNLCSDLGRQKILQQTVWLLQQRRVWGSAQKFVKVVLRLGDAREITL